jgi:hypothetical protein
MANEELSFINWTVKDTVTRLRADMGLHVLCPFPQNIFRKGLDIESGITCRDNL